MSGIFLWTSSSGVIVRKSIFGQISLKCFATGPDFFVFMFDLCSVNRSRNFLLVSPTYMALQFEHFIAYTTPSDWQLRFSLRGTSVLYYEHGANTGEFGREVLIESKYSFVFEPYQTEPETF